MTEELQGLLAGGCFCDQMRAEGYREVCAWCLCNKDWSRAPTPAEGARPVEQEPPSDDLFDGKAFGAQVSAKLKADRRSFREAAPFVPCSSATLHRVAQGKMPDAENYLRISRWLTEADTPGRHLADTLFDAIAHGDDEHRAWLKQAISDHLAGKPVERPRGKGSTEQITSLLASLTAKDAEIAGLRAALIRIADTDWYTTRRKPHPTGGLRGHGGMIACFALIGENGSYHTNESMHAALEARALHENPESKA